MYLFLIVSIAVVFIILLIFMPLLQVRALKENDNTTEIKIQIKDLENKFRLTIAQIFGGIIILFGAYATIKSIDENQKKRLRENFNEAVLNLSSTESNSDLKKVASVYIIESVSKELSDEYYKTSMEIFSYYLNMNVNRKNSTDSTTSLVINSIFDVFGNQKHINYNGKYSFLEFKDLNLKGLSVYKGDYSNISTYKVDFTNAEMQRCDFTRGQFFGTDYINSTLSDNTFNNSMFSDCKFTNASIVGNSFENVKFINCDFRKLKVGWYGAVNKPIFLQKFSDSGFQNCICDSVSFNDGNFINSSIDISIFIGANFENSQLQNSHLFGTDFRTANFKNANFENTEINNCNFSGSDLTGSNIEKTKYLRMVNLANVIGLTDMQNSWLRKNYKITWNNMILEKIK